MTPFDSPGSTRRHFLQSAGALAGSPLLTAAGSDTTVARAEVHQPAGPLILSVNGERHELMLEPRVTLLDALRDLGPHGHKEGLRPRPMRGVHRADQRKANQCLPHACSDARRR